MTIKKLALRPYQLDQVKLLRQKFKKHRKVGLQIPTGGGKTEIAIHIIQMYFEKNMKVLFVTSSIDLINQTYYRFIKHFDKKDVSIFRADDPKRNGKALIQIVSIDTYVRRKDFSDLDGVKFVIIDEAHEAVAPKYLEKFFPNFTDQKILGLSATFQLVANKAHEYWDDFVAEIDGQYLNDLGFCPDIKILCPDISYNISNVKTVNGDYNQKQLSEALDKSKIYSDFKDNFIKYGMNKLAIAFCSSIKFAEKIEKVLKNVGASNVIIYHSKLSRIETANKMKLLRDCARDKKPACLICIDKVSKGFDMPELEVGFMMRPSKSIKVYRQLVGRLTRGKDKILLVDMTDNIFRLGHPYDFISPVREKRKRFFNIPTPFIRCDDCLAVFENNKRICPYCGAKKVMEINRNPIEDKNIGLKEYQRTQGHKNKKMYNKYKGFAKYKRIPNPHEWAINKLYNERKELIFSRVDFIEATKKRSKERKEATLEQIREASVSP